MSRNKKLLLAIIAVFAVTIGLLGFQSALSESDYAMNEVSKKIEKSSAVEKSIESEELEETSSPSSEEAAEELQEDDDSEKKQEENDSASEDHGESNKEEHTEKKSVASSDHEKGQVTSSTDQTASNSNSDSVSSKETDNRSTDKKVEKEQTSQKEKKTNKEPETKETVPTVTYSIVAESDTILAPVTVEINEGDTVLDVLINVTRKNKIHMSFRGGTGANAYVEGIDNLYEFDRGQGSGWMYRVNGIFPNRGAGVVPLLDGDVIEWLYTVDLGKDLGAELQPFRP
ncbi:DUF4430 domain-containing protein [Halalkalibacter sp. AB-rgal2]|uniref:DUF4430 domain-containing protein n=1 Tax=Halalkalibacter sp. AB-rgal2 TaxID=3242695 RepID=UPI00359ECADF